MEALAGMLSVPLIWHDAVVGVLNVQTRDPRSSPTDEIDFLRTIAALLAGIVEKGRLTAEVEARLAQLTALDAARAELLCVVTHELRTPLSVVRVYVDLLADAATASDEPDPRRRRLARRRRRPAGRLDRLVDSILASVRGEGLTDCRARHSMSSRRSTRPSRRCGSCCGRTRSAGSGRTARSPRSATRPVPPGARAAPRERIEVRADAPTA